MTSGHVAARIAYRVTIDDVDVEVEAAPDARVGDLLDALACPTPFRLADGRVPPPSARLADLGIRHGDRWTTGADASTAFSSGDRWVVREVATGTVLGAWPASRPGVDVSVGRDPAAAVHLDDPSVSRCHGRFTLGESATFADLGSTNGSRVDGVDVAAVPDGGGEVRLADGSVVEVGEAAVELQRVSVSDARIACERAPMAVGGTIVFNRPPRVPFPSSAVRFRAPEPPTPPRRQRLPWMSASVPAVLALVIVGAGWSAGGAFGGAMLWWSAGFLLLSPLTILVAQVEQRRAAASQAREDRAEFARRCDRVAADARAALAREVAVRRAEHPPASELSTWARDAGERLFESGAEAPVLRVGVGDVPSSVRVVSDRSSSDGPGSERGEGLGPDADEASARLASEVATARDVPVVATFEGGDLGVVGEPAARRAACAALVLRAATVTAPSALTLVVVTSDPDAWGWVRWLPCEVVVGSSESVGAALAGGDVVDERVVVVLFEMDEAVGAAGAGAFAAIRAGVARPGVAMRAVWSASERTALPATCVEVVDVAGRFTGDTAAGSVVVEPVVVDLVTAADAEDWARSLAPYVEADPAGRAQRPVPAVVPLAGLLAATAPPASPSEPARRPGATGGASARGDLVEMVLRRWTATADDRRRLAVPIGEGADGPVLIDLVADGPHAVIGGTTGSGKSELLQTLVAGLAASAPPDRVNVLLVDFKGGATFADVAALPHCVGVVTDLDGPLIERVVLSLGAELRRRERVLAEAGVPDLAMLPASGDTSLPRLVVVIDEYAALVGGVEDVGAAVADLARRGRSLGVHLVLATQRPAGVVADEMWANASLRIALRVADPEDSRDVIGTDDAAAIPPTAPGRAMLVRGPAPAVVVQTAHAAAVGGAVADAAVGSRRRRRPAVVVRPWPAQPSAGGGEGSLHAATGQRRSDLAAVVAAVRTVADGLGAPCQRRPWLPPLPEVWTWSDMVAGSDMAAASSLGRAWSSTGGEPRSVAPHVVVGLADVPDRQAQEVMTLDLADVGSVLVVGAGGHGPSACLAAMAVSVVGGRDPDDVRLDVVDGSGRLGGLAGFPQVGSVMPPTDHERVGRLLADLAARLGSPPSGQRRVLAVDGLGAFVAAHERYAGGAALAALARVVADGPAAGVHVICSADRRGAVPLALAGSLGARVVMTLAASDEYAVWEVPDAGRWSSRCPGRAVVDGVEVQTMVLDATGPGSMGALAAVDRDRFGDRAATPVEVLPELVLASTLPPQPGNGAVWLGLADDDLAPVAVDLAEGHLLVAGPPGSGRSSTLVTLARSLRGGPAPVELILVVDRGSAVASAEAPGLWDRIVDDPATLDELVAARADEGDEPTGLVVLMADDVTELDEVTEEALARAARDGLGRGVRLVVAAEAAAARSSYGELLTRLRRRRRALLLQPDPDLDGDLAGVRLPRRPGPDAVPGRGELVLGGRARRIQVVAPSVSMGEIPHGGPASRFLR